MGRVLSSLWTTSFAKFRSLLDKDQSGAAAVEYGLVVALIASAIIGSVQAIGTSLSAIFNSAVPLP